jgi:hypothetical protein
MLDNTEHQAHIVVMKTKWGKCLTIIGGIGAGYFTFGSILWILYFAMPIFKGHSIDSQAYFQQGLIALPCFFLSILFWVATFQVSRRYNVAKLAIIIGIMLTVLLFLYDTSHGHYQANLFAQNEDSHIYLTWWFSGMSK